ncbi:MAG: hypothetical protein IRY94_16580, partial [Rhodospirillaceae bacterium]|nr:hypothetical protein [Rhodospirillaceae bacterium]
MVAPLLARRGPVAAPLDRGTVARRTGVLVLGLLAAALSGCAGEASQPACPAVARLPDADRLTRFVGSGRDLTDVAFEARIGEVSASCDYDDSGYDVVAKVQ